MKGSLKYVCISLSVMSLMMLALGGCGKKSDDSSSSSGTSFLPNVNL